MENEFEEKYRTLFRRYYAGLSFYAARLVGEDDAEDIVQDVFLEIWKRKDTVELGGQIQSFLYRSVYTRAINVLNHKAVVENYTAEEAELMKKKLEYYQPDQSEVIRRIENRELRQEIFQAINGLPEKCREVFKLSYLYDMKNKDIADIKLRGNRPLRPKSDSPALFFPSSPCGNIPLGLGREAHLLFRRGAARQIQHDQFVFPRAQQARRAIEGLLRPDFPISAQIKAVHPYHALFTARHHQMRVLGIFHGKTGAIEAGPLGGEPVKDKAGKRFQGQRPMPPMEQPGDAPGYFLQNALFIPQMGVGVIAAHVLHQNIQPHAFFFDTEFHRRVFPIAVIGAHVLPVAVNIRPVVQAVQN